MSGPFFYYFQCMDCSRTALAPLNDPDPDGWGYDDDEAAWVCPDHASRLVTG